MSYIGVQRQTDSTLFGPNEYSIAAGALVDFNTDLDYFGGSDPAVTYDTATHVFTFTKPGYYYVDWFLVLQSAFSTYGPTFTLVARTGSTETDYPSTSSFKTGTLSGSAIISAQAGTTLSLRNDTGAVAIFANNILDTTGLGIVANIAIVRYVQEPTGLEVGLNNGTTIANGAIVPYNTALSTTITNSEITNNAGTFTFGYTGVYLFDWKVSIAGLDLPSNEIKFELRRNGTDVIGMSVSPVVTQGFITGTAIASITAGQTVALYNNTVDANTPATGVSIEFANLSLQATMRIFTLI